MVAKGAKIQEKLNKALKKSTNLKNRNLKTVKLKDRIVLDTSVIIEGIISKKVGGEIKPKEILIHEAVLSELEAQANRNRESGFLGLEEINTLRKLSKKHRFILKYIGKKPEQAEIKQEVSHRHQ